MKEKGINDADSTCSQANVAKDWLSKAANLAKFSTMAGLGVILCSHNEKRGPQTLIRSLLEIPNHKEGFRQLFCIYRTMPIFAGKKVRPIETMVNGMVTGDTSFQNKKAEPYEPLRKYRGKCEVDPVTKKSFCNGKIVGAQGFWSVAVYNVRKPAVLKEYNKPRVAPYAGWVLGSGQYGFYSNCTQKSRDGCCCSQVVPLSSILTFSCLEVLVTWFTDYEFKCCCCIQTFIPNAPILKLCAQALRVAKRAPAPTRTKKELLQPIRKEIEISRDANDMKRFRCLIREGMERLKNVD
ncbi:hypothetical protein CTI12_AA017890 [Artemisia annua]|uniref:Uncharacterized protein n=1 Tax=Artemisia annua TaxID=35608 RepID=A0A2U1QIH9_ARTAN|nr:hypothetical protein CTI12_AA017890 [Artemisia annua]